MWYACSCGHRELIWNSRDGVTPFGGVPCTSCGGDGLTGGLNHVDWRLDEIVPGYVLNIGQLFFRDGNSEDAVGIINRRISAFELAGRKIPGGVATTLLREAQDQTGDEWRPGWPVVDRWDEAKNKKSIEGRKK